MIRTEWAILTTEELIHHIQEHTKNASSLLIETMQRLICAVDIIERLRNDIDNKD